ncbi:hypothetical protein L7F22_036948 [Adiantum nelumboides]|nr:hypothetical protein [Adiantum nelumboides]
MRASTLDHADQQDVLKMIYPPPFPKCLWGNVVARGLLASASNFAPLLVKMSVCFAASRDSCNLIEMVCQLAKDYKGDCTIHLNDADPNITVRNYIMVELLRMYGDKAIHDVITLWYSIWHDCKAAVGNKGSGQESTGLAAVG